MKASTIAFKEKPDSAESLVGLLHPLVKQWFFAKFPSFSLPQQYGILEVHKRQNILICAPTGATKTLTSMLSILNELVDSAEKSILQDKVYCVYISPLRALSRDIRKNLIEPLEEIEALAGKKLGIRVAMRTGDTTTREKAKMLAEPPHIIVTTPESLSIMLSSIKFRDYLKQVDWCVVDEIHALAENKRGVHLNLSLELLQYLSPGMCRVGLSATVSPLETVAQWLVGKDRNCLIVNVQFIKNLDVQVISPVPDLMSVSYEEISSKTYALIDQLIHEHKTTLIFTNTRSATERVVHHLKDRFPKKYMELSDDPVPEARSLIGAHHGSLSKEHRFQIEDSLRQGKLKAVCCSTSLELGIDIGYIDLVICLGSPKSVARFLQRCLPYESRVLLANGTYKSIGEIVEEKQDVDILSYDPKQGFTKNRIKAYHKNKTETLLKISFHSGLSLQCTEEHPILTKTGWKEAKNILPGEEVAEAFNFEAGKMPYIYEMIDQSDFYVENRNDFLRKVIDAYVQKERISYSKLSREIGIKQNHLQNYIRRIGRRKSIRLDLFLKMMKICKVKQPEYLPYLRELKSKSFHRKPLPLKPDADLMWLSGMVASDGAIVENKKTKELKIKIGNMDIKLLEECQKIFNSYGFYPKILKRKYDGFRTLDCGSKLLAQFMLSLGLKKGKAKSLNIEVSNVLNRFPKGLVIPYIEGLLEGDGNKDSNIRIFSASKNFVIGLHNLLNRCGIHNYFVRDEAKASKLIQKINAKYTYCLYVGRNKYVQEFLKYCIFKGKKARFLSNKKYNYSHKYKDIEPNIHWTKVLSVEKESKETSVYNLTLENEPNTYFVESILTHNCGRAGHKLHQTVKGRLIVTDRDDLVECALLLKNAVEKKIDRLHMPTKCLDVLAQHVYGFSLAQVWDEKELYKVLTSSYCFQDVPYADYEEILKYLAGEFASLEDRYIYAKIWRNDGKLGKRGMLGRVIYMTNLGTIPDESFITVKVGEHVIGHIDEGFLEKLKRGDIFVLGGDVYEFLFARGMVAQVKAAAGRKPTIPSWFSEMLPLSFDLAVEVQKFRKLVEEKFAAKRSKAEIVKFMHEYLYVDANAAEAIYQYCKEQYEFVGMPHLNKLLIEYYTDEYRTQYVVFHTLFGRRVNDVLSRAVAFAIGRAQHRDVEVGITDNGFFVRAAQKVHIMPILKLVKSGELRQVMVLAIEKSEVLKRRFRHCAARAFMILRTYKGHTKRVGRQQVSSMILMNAVKRISDDFCVLREARREVLEDLMDVENATVVLKAIEEGKFKVEEVQTQIPSPFAFNLILQGYSDILKMEDRHEFLQRMHAMVLAKTGLKKGKSAPASYEDLWEKAEERRLAERDPEKEKLKEMALNVEHMPSMAKRELVKIIEENATPSQHFIAGVKRYKKEIEAHWPKELQKVLFEKVKVE